MNKRQKLFALVLSLILVMTICLSGCGAPKKDSDGIKKIGFLHQDATWEMYQVQEAAVKALCDEKGIELVSANPSSDPAKQLEQFESLVNSGCDAIISVTVDGTVLESAVKSAVESGVIVLSEFVPVEGASCNIEVDEYGYGVAIGSLAGKYCAEHFEGERIECALLRMFDYEPGIERARGMRDSFLELFPTGVIVNEQDSVDVESAMSATEAILAANPDCRVFLCDSDDTGAIGAYQALMSYVDPADYDKYVVIGADGTDKGFELTAEGGMYRGTVDLQNEKLGQQAFQIIMDLSEGKEVETTQYLNVLPVDYEIAKNR